MVHVWFLLWQDKGLACIYVPAPLPPLFRCYRTARPRHIWDGGRGRHGPRACPGIWRRHAAAARSRWAAALGGLGERHEPHPPICLREGVQLQALLMTYES